MDTRHFSYTIPSSIEGEPEEVAAIAKKQVLELSAEVARLSADTFVQLRAAGIDPELPDAEQAWLDSKDGVAAADFVWSATVFVEAAKAL